MNSIGREEIQTQGKYYLDKLYDWGNTDECPVKVGEVYTNFFFDTQGEILTRVTSVLKDGTCKGGWRVWVEALDGRQPYGVTNGISVQWLRPAPAQAPTFEAAAVRYAKALQAKYDAFRKAAEAKVAAEATLDEYYEAKADLFKFIDKE